MVVFEDMTKIATFVLNLTPGSTANKIKLLTHDVIFRLYKANWQSGITFWPITQSLQLGSFSNFTQQYPSWGGHHGSNLVLGQASWINPSPTPSPRESNRSCPRGWRPAQQPDGQRTWGGSVAGADKRISAGNDD